MTPLFTNLSNKTNTDDIMKELKERRDKKIIGKPEEKEKKTIEIELEEGDQEKINKFHSFKGSESSSTLFAFSSPSDGFTIFCNSRVNNFCIEIFAFWTFHKKKI